MAQSARNFGRHGRATPVYVRWTVSYQSGPSGTHVLFRVEGANTGVLATLSQSLLTEVSDVVILQNLELVRQSHVQWIVKSVTGGAGACVMQLVMVVSSTNIEIS